MASIRFLDGSGAQRIEDAFSDAAQGVVQIDIATAFLTDAGAQHVLDLLPRFVS
jgi:hypothetical protein